MKQRTALDPFHRTQLGVPAAIMRRLPAGLRLHHGVRP